VIVCEDEKYVTVRCGSDDETKVANTAAHHQLQRT